MSALTNGDNGVVTEAEVQRAAQMALGMLELPDFAEMVSTSIQSDGEAIRNALELLVGEERYAVEIVDVKGLEDRLKQLAVTSQGSPGGTSKPAVYRFIRDAIADGVIGGGSSLPDQSGNNGKFLSTDGTDASWETPTGLGDLVGPSSAADNSVPTYDGTTGKLVQDQGSMFIDDDGNVGIGTTDPSARLHLPAGTATAGTAPFKLTSGTVLTTTEAGAIEFGADNFYGTITSGAGTSFSPQYPPAHSDTYVKATSKLNTNYWPHYATDPAISLTGSWSSTSWLSNGATNQRFHMDLGSAKTITRVYYENAHNSGGGTNAGVQNFTVWGSNDATAFPTLTYGTDTDWTEITPSQTSFDQHVASNVADPKYITLTNSTAYRYYAFKFADNWGDASYMGLRHIELQTGGTARKTFVMTDALPLGSGRVPYTTTNGRLADSANFVFDGANLGVGTDSPSSKLSVSGGGTFGSSYTTTAAPSNGLLVEGNVGIGTTAPDTLLHNAGAYTQQPLSSDPADPDAGNSVQWVSDGTGTGDAGDVLLKVNVGGTTKIITLIDYSIA